VEIAWYTAMSMDGRIASAGHSLAFLDTLAGSGLNDFEEFMRDVDGVLVGAGTLRWLVAGGHGWPHADLPTWLVSHDAALAESLSLRRVEGDLGPALAEIEAAGLQRVWLAGGGDVAAQVLALDRLDEVIVSIAPTVLGDGPSLFDGAVPATRFELVECRSAGDGVRLRWRRRVA
jgi:riboflavin biosynthesis pyrimidine reductase